jgi:hypothetical protein
MLWQEYPPGSPTHEEAPYGFKLFALKDARERGYTTLLWLDSYCRFSRHPQPLFDHIERQGHWFIHGDSGDTVGKWTSDKALELFGITRDQGFEGPLLLAGSVYGLDLTNPRTQEFFRRWMELLELGAFAGPYLNDGPNLAAARAGLGHRPIGVASKDPRCWGHRHDEVAAGFLAWKMGLVTEPIGQGFYTAWTPEDMNDPRRVVLSG